MGRLADLLTSRGELNLQERHELAGLLDRLENDVRHAWIAGESVTFPRRVLFQREIDLAGRWVFQQSTTLDRLNFINQATGNAVLAFDNLGDEVFIRTNLNFAVPAAITISGGIISVSHTYTRVQNEGGAATDDLDTINEAAGASIGGRLLILQAFDDAQTVVVKDGTGNIRLAGDMSLDSEQDTIVLLGDSKGSGNWYELCRSNNA